jgi:hypothetical protein
MTARTRVRMADVERVLKVAKRQGVGCEIDLVTGIARLGGPPDLTAPRPGDSPPPQDPLDAELAEWSQSRGYG